MSRSWMRINPYLFAQFATATLMLLVAFGWVADDQTTIAGGDKTVTFWSLAIILILQQVASEVWKLRQQPPADSGD